MSEKAPSDSEKTKHKGPLPIEEFLKPLLELSGIRDFVEVELFLYTTRGGGLNRLKIRTYPMFLHTLGSGSYQIAIAEPTIEGLGSEPFKMTFLSVEIDWDTTNGWSAPTVVTDWEEEIFPEETSSQRLKDRATKIGKKVRAILEFVVLVKDFSGLFGVR